MSDAEYIKAVEDENGRLKELVDKLNFRIAELEDEKSEMVRKFLSSPAPTNTPVYKNMKAPKTIPGYQQTYTSNNTVMPTFNLEELKKHAQAGTIVQYVNKVMWGADNK